MHPSELALDGVVSWQDLVGLGLDPYAVRLLLRRSELLRLARGWYAVRPPDAARAPWEASESWERAARRHKLTTLALVRSFEGRAAASHESAVLLHQGWRWGDNTGVVHLERVSDDHSRHRRGAVLHPRIATSLMTLTEGLDLPGGYLVVPPALAAIQAGLRTGAPDSSRALHALVAADGFLHAGLITGTELSEGLELFSGVPGIHAVREVLRWASGLSESPGETLMCHSLRVMGYSFTQQVLVGDGFRTDVLLDGEPTCVEFDGYSKYLKDIQNPTPADLRMALAREKARHDELVRDGYGIARITARIVRNLAAIRREVEAARSRARRLAT